MILNRLSDVREARGRSHRVKPFIPVAPVIPDPDPTPAVSFTVSNLPWRTVGTVDGDDATVNDVVRYPITTTFSADFQINAESGTEFESLTPSIATVDENGTVEGVGAGTASIRLTKVGRQNTIVNRGCYTDSGTYGFSSFVEGSLAKYLYDYVVDGINGKTPEGNLLSFLQFGGEPFGAYQPHPNCWVSLAGDAATLDCLMLRNSAFGTSCGGVLISDSHMLFTKHSGFYPHVGVTVTLYSTTEEGTETRTISAVLVHPTADIVVAKLNTAIETIDPITVLPADWVDYLPCKAYAAVNGRLAEQLPDSPVPVLVTEKQKRISPWLLRVMGNSGAFYRARNDSWSVSLVSGDSGHVCALPPVNGRLVLVCLHSGNGTGVGTLGQRAWINAAMNTLSSTVDDYALEEADFSAFTNFS